MSQYRQHPDHMVQIPINVGQEAIWQPPKRQKDTIGVFILFSLCIFVFLLIVFLLWTAYPSLGAF